MSGPTLNEIAKALGGEVHGGEVRAPGPGHNARDRSLIVVLSDDQHDGFAVKKSFAGDDVIACRDYVRARVGLPPFKPNGGHGNPARTISYDYRDASGIVRYRKKRFDHDDGTKFCCFYQLDGAKGLGGAAHLLYGGERLADLGEGQPVWIVEGEKKVERLRELGAIAVSGDAGAQSKWLPAHGELLRGLPVILWPDSDEPGEAYIANAAAAIWAVDPGADIRVVRPFGAPNGGKGRDVCDWTGNADSLSELASGANPYAPLSQRNSENPIKLLSYAEMVSLPPAEWLIDFVLPMRSKSVLFGLSDSFKSFLAIAMACAVSTGRTWHGAAVKQCKVIYLANEGPIGVGRKRIPAWMAANEIPDGLRANIFLVKADAIIPDAKSRANLIAAVREHVEPGETFLLVIDVLRGTMNGSESDDEAANAWTTAAESLVTEGASILAVTHSPYGEDGRMRGHSHLWGSFDTRLQAEGDKEKMTTVLKVNRHKDHDSAGQWGFHLDEQSIPEHPGETSLVPRLDGEVKARAKSKRGKGEPKEGEIISAQYLETYDRLADGAEKCLGLNFKEVRKVSVDAIRDELKRRGILTKTDKRGGLTSAASTALSKAKRGLIHAGTLVENDDFIWRP